MRELSTEDLKRMFANPIYCLKTVEGWHMQGKPIVSRKVWKRAVIKTIESGEMSLDEWLEALLNNLEGK